MAPRSLFAFLALLIVGLAPLSAALHTYDFPDSVGRSDLYEITIRQGDDVRTPFVPITRCPRQVNPLEKILPLLYDRTFSWVSFAFDGAPVEVQIRKRYGAPAKGVVISPRRAGVVADSFDGHTVRFRLSKPEYISVRFLCPENSDEYDQIRHGLMLFADDPETEVPALGDPGVVVYSPEADLANARTIVFPPGVHDLVASLPNGMLPVHDNQTIYLAGGAWIYGGIQAPGTVNVKVHGRGVLCGVKQRFHYPGLPQLLELEPWNYRTNVHRGGHSTVEGITLLESFNHNLAVGPHSLVKDTKFIGWKVNNDGLRSGDDCVIDHVFMKVSDDHLYAFSTTLIRRSLFWPMWNGAILQIGWGNYGGSGTRFVNNDIINPEWNQIWHNNGVLASQVRPDSRNSDILIQDLRIEGNINALANLHFNSSSRGTDLCSGYIKDITFRNIEVDGGIVWQNNQPGWYDSIAPDINFDVTPAAIVRRGTSLLKGFKNDAGQKAFVHHVVFENVRINGTTVTEENHADFFTVDLETTHDIRFLRTQNHEPTLSHRPGYAHSDDYTMVGLGAGTHPRPEKQPEQASHYGWLAAGQRAAWTVELPEAGNFDVKCSVASGLRGGEYAVRVDDQRATEVFSIHPIGDNGYNLHKQVSKKPVTLAKGTHRFAIEAISGTSLPDYIELSPSTGTPPRVTVKVVSVSTMQTTGDTWTAAKLNLGVTRDALRFNSRAGVVINPDERGPAAPLPITQVAICNPQGEILIRLESRELLREIDISALPLGVYFAVFSDQRTFWIAKQFVK